MSYILDALRRADAERERGAVPNLHAQQQFAPGAGDDESEGRPKWLWWLIGGLAVALVAGLAWNLLGTAPGPAVAPAPAAQPMAVTPAPASLPAATNQAPPTSTPALPAVPATPPVAATPPAPAAMPPSRAPNRSARATRPAADEAAPGDERSRRAGSRSEPRTSSRRDARTSEQTNAGNTTGRAGATAESAARGESTRDRSAGAETHAAAEAPKTAQPEGGRIVPQRELPEDVRRALPNFKIGGSAYSSDPSSRMLMINGQIFREGDAVAAGLVLKQIRPKGAVFEFRGYRYEMGF
jgi:general secretion pathway protein B